MVITVLCCARRIEHLTIYKRSYASKNTLSLILPWSYGQTSILWQLNWAILDGILVPSLSAIPERLVEERLNENQKTGDSKAKSYMSVTAVSHFLQTTDLYSNSVILTTEGGTLNMSHLTLLYEFSSPTIGP